MRGIFCYNTLLMTYKNKKIERFDLHPNSGITAEYQKHDFDEIDSYFDDVKKYIHTDILMTDYTQPIELAFKSRLQILMSSILNRSLLLKEGAVQALNDSNLPSFYANVKSFMEIAGMFGYVAHLIYHNDDYKEILAKMHQLSLGNKESGMFFSGKASAINVMTMLEKADKMFQSGSTPEENAVTKTPLGDSYADVCNFGHPNWSAHLSAGILHHKTMRWEAKIDSTGYKTELYAFYMPGFSLAIGAIHIFCSMIDRCPKVNHFEGVNSKNLFP